MFNIPFVNMLAHAASKAVASLIPEKKKGWAGLKPKKQIGKRIEPERIAIKGVLPPRAERRNAARRLRTLRRWRDLSMRSQIKGSAQQVVSVPDLSVDD